MFKVLANVNIQEQLFRVFRGLVSGLCPGLWEMGGLWETLITKWYDL